MVAKKKRMWLVYLINETNEKLGKNINDNNNEPEKAQISIITLLHVWDPSKSGEIRLKQKKKQL